MLVGHSLLHFLRPYCGYQLLISHFYGLLTLSHFRLEFTTRISVKRELSTLPGSTTANDLEHPIIMKTEIMYIEDKEGSIVGTGRIGRVTFSKSGKTLKYKGKEFRSLKGYGYKANYYDVTSQYEDGTFDFYWISGCKKNGQDTLYQGIVEIDEDVREEYWLEIRNKPECIAQISFRSEGKHAGWREKQFIR